MLLKFQNVVIVVMNIKIKPNMKLLKIWILLKLSRKELYSRSKSIRRNHEGADSKVEIGKLA